MIEKKFCRECGDEVSIHVVVPEKIYAITDDGNLKRDDNNDAFYRGNSYVKILCNNDTEHEVGINESESEWFQKIDEALEKEGVLT